MSLITYLQFCILMHAQKPQNPQILTLIIPGDFTNELYRVGSKWTPDNISPYLELEGVFDLVFGISYIYRGWPIDSKTYEVQ